MHSLQNRQKVHPTPNTHAEPGTAHGAAMLQWAQERELALFSSTPILSRKWRNGGRGGKQGLAIHAVRMWAGTPQEGLALPG